MIDTLGFFVIIDQSTYDSLSNRSIKTERIDQETGNIEFEYNNFHTHHSYNYKVMYKLENKAHQYDPATKTPYLVESLPYIRFEFSAPKILWGNNLESCSLSDAVYAASIVRDEFNKTYNINIAKVMDWYCYRIDTSANFLLENEDQVKAYIRYLQRLDYPRRIKNNYEDSGIYFASRHQTLKIYAKGDEFKKHDKKRFLDETEQERLQQKASKILRIEVEHKTKLKSIVEGFQKDGLFIPTFRGYPRFNEILQIFNPIEEMEKIVKKFLSGLKTKIMKNLEVFEILKANMTEKAARSKYAIYMLIIQHGQKEAKRQTPKRTFQRAMKTFRELGISIAALNENEVDYFLDKDFPDDFELTMSKENKYYQMPLDISKIKGIMDETD